MNNHSLLTPELKHSPFGVWLLDSSFYVIDVSDYILNTYKKLVLKDSFIKILSSDERKNILLKLKTEQSVKIPYQKYKNQNEFFVFMNTQNNNILVYYIVEPVISDNINIESIFDNLNKSSQFKIDANFKENIMSICYMLEEINKTKDKNVKEFAKKINTLCFRMLKNIENINIISLDTGIDDNFTGIINIWDELASLFTEMNSIFMSERLKFTYTLPMEDDYVKCSLNRFAFAIINLIGNAFLYGEKNSTVEVIGTRTDTYVTITIKNTIKSNLKNTVSEFFEPFYTNGDSKTMGIGLNAVDTVVKELHGNIVSLVDEDTLNITLTVPTQLDFKDMTMSAYTPDYTQNRFSILNIGLSDIITPKLD